MVNLEFPILLSYLGYLLRVALSVGWSLLRVGAYEAALATSIVKAKVTMNTERNHPDTPTGVLSEFEKREDLQDRRGKGSCRNKSEKM